VAGALADTTPARGVSVVSERADVPASMIAARVCTLTLARRGPGLVCSRESTVPYALRGLLFCAACGRRMQGAARVGKRTTRILYRCELGKSRSVPADLSDHPRTVYLREDEVTVQLDEWIATLADPDDLARGQDADPGAGTGYAALQRQLSEANRKVAALVNAVESGVAVEDLTAVLRRRTTERDELKTRLERAERPRAMSAAQISELVEELAGCQRCLVRQSGRNAHRCMQAWACVSTTTHTCDGSRRRPTYVVSPDVCSSRVLKNPLVNTLHRLGRECEHSRRSPQSCVRGGLAH
jgi:Recombinase zinc beta ribbon domain